MKWGQHVYLSRAFASHWWLIATQTIWIKKLAFHWQTRAGNWMHNAYPLITNDSQSTANHQMRRGKNLSSGRRASWQAKELTLSEQAWLQGLVGGKITPRQPSRQIPLEQEFGDYSSRTLADSVGPRFQLSRSTEVRLPGPARQLHLGRMVAQTTASAAGGSRW